MLSKTYSKLTQHRARARERDLHIVDRCECMSVSGARGAFGAAAAAVGAEAAAAALRKA